MQNSGTSTSENTTIQITDEDGFNLTRTAVFSSGESQSFHFNDYPLQGMVEHIINISYYPTSLESIKTDDNSGTAQLILLEGEGTEDETGTPGFELIILVIALALIVMIKRKK